MKRFLSLITLLVVSVAVMPVADAKKFGGGRSLGNSFKTAPAPKQQYSNPKTQDTKAGQTQNAGRKGLMGGLLGGLLAGGLLAAFFGGAFEGIQFMDILIIGLVAYFIFKLLRGMLAAKQGSMNQQQPAFGGTAHRQSHVHDFEQPEDFSAGGGGFGAHAASDVPHRYPPAFDRAAFLNGAREHYRILQGAWNHNELDTIREYVSASLFDDLQAEREKLTGEQHTDVMYVDAEFVRADYDENRAQLSLQFSGRYRDVVEGIEEEIQDVWHLERDLTVANAPWLIVGIQG
ncbi:Tim44 domain-containing protein [Vibrio rhizosphaerae]|uniref:TIM44-like domain-containing protein n=1 Tax=Vibrio rhizosphaerae TaxID=398736 RepID=A0ABU4ITP7_9VIBR|nr:TIM44-like domain-containing protein [Vibrio rhizosphaerae]MDW6092503.1 TIM44-like domain-containing protein [Vibrio rhizosphaerae]